MTSLALFLVFTLSFLLTIWRPRIFIFSPVVFSASYLVRFKILGYSTTLLEILILSVLLASLVLFVSARLTIRDLFIDVSHKQLLLISLFILAATVSIFVAPHPRTAWGVWKAMIVEPILLSLAITTVAKEKKYKYLIISGLLGGVIIVIISAVYPRLGVDFGRFRGIYDVPNSLALVMAPLLSMSILSGIVFKKHMLMSFILALVFGFLLLMTQSLGGILASVCVILVFALIQKKKLLFGLMLLLITVAVLFQVGSGKIQHLISADSSSFIARQQIWAISLQLIASHPVFGTGLGTFEPAYQDALREYVSKQTQKKFVPLEWVVRDPHNFILSFWLNTGILGPISILALVCIRLKSFFRDIEINKEKAVLGLALLTVILFGLLDVPYWKNDLAVLWWMLLI